jgi:predicted phage terminase large subunit-like protein
MENIEQKFTQEITPQDALDNFGIWVSLFTDPEYLDDVQLKLALEIDRQIKSFDKNKGLMSVTVLPRGFLKSHIMSILLPLWLVTGNERERVLIVSNTMTNAAKFLAKIRSICERHPLYRAWYPHRVPTSFRHVKWSDAQADLVRTLPSDVSNFECAGAGTQLTSRHYSTIIEDDTIAPELDDMTQEMAMPTQDDIDQAIGFHKLTNSLIDTMGTSKRFVVGTRWTAADLLQYVQNNEEHEKFEISCMEEDNYVFDSSTNDFVGEVTPTYPKRFNRDALARYARNYGSYYFNTLYMNNPMRPEDMTFAPSHLEYFDTLPEEAIIKITVDPSGLAAKPGCYDAIVSCGHVPGKIYVNRYKLDRYKPSGLVKNVLDMAEDENASEIVIEAVIYQKSLIYLMEDEMRKRGRYFNVTPIKPHRDKDTRIRSLEPWIEYHALFIRKGMRELVQHITEYPYGSTLDLLDALAYQVPKTEPSQMYVPQKVQDRVPWLTQGQYLDEMIKGNSLYPIPSHLVN